MLIKIIKGAYGYKPSQSSAVKLKDRYSEAFEVYESEGKRLITLGIAERIENQVEADDTGVATLENASESTEPGSSKDEPESASETIFNGSGELGNIPDYSLNMSINELRALGKEHGLSFKVGTTKSAIIDALNEHFGICSDTDELPDVDAGDSVI